MGAGKAMAAAKARQRERLMKGGRCFLTSAALTLDDTAAEMSLAFRGLFRRCRALLMDRRVGEPILVVETDEWLHTGSPVDRLTRVAPVDRALVSWEDPDRNLSRDRVDSLLQLLGGFVVSPQPSAFPESASPSGGSGRPSESS